MLCHLRPMNFLNSIFVAVRLLIHIRFREIVSSCSRITRQEGQHLGGVLTYIFSQAISKKGVNMKEKTNCGCGGGEGGGLLRAFKSANGNDLTIWARLCWAYIFNILSLSKDHLNLYRNDISSSFKLMKDFIEKIVATGTMYLCSVSLFLSFQWLLNSLPCKLFGRECFRFAELVSGLNRLVFHSTVQPQSLHISKAY